MKKHCVEHSLWFWHGDVQRRAADEIGKILPTPLDGFTWAELRSMSCVTKVRLVSPPSGQGGWALHAETRAALAFESCFLCAGGVRGGSFSEMNAAVTPSS